MGTVRARGWLLYERTIFKSLARTTRSTDRTDGRTRACSRTPTPIAAGGLWPSSCFHLQTMLDVTRTHPFGDVGLTTVGVLTLTAIVLQSMIRVRPAEGYAPPSTAQPLSPTSYHFQPGPVLIRNTSPTPNPAGSRRRCSCARCPKTGRAARVLWRTASLHQHTQWLSATSTRAL